MGRYVGNLKEAEGALGRSGVLGNLEFVEAPPPPRTLEEQVKMATLDGALP